MENEILSDILLKEIERIGNIKREGIIITCNEEELIQLLNVKKLHNMELTYLRNALVKRIADKIENIRMRDEYEPHYKEAIINAIEKEHAIMTVVTGIIDKEYYNR